MRGLPQWFPPPPLSLNDEAKSSWQAVKSGDGEAVEALWVGTCHSSTFLPRKGIAAQTVWPWLGNFLVF